MEFDRYLRVALQPALERDDPERPAERETRDGDRDVEEHHHVVVPLAHRRDRQLLRAHLEDEPAAREEERRERLSGRARWQDAARRTEPEEEVREAPHDGERAEEVAPQLVDLHLEDVLLVMRGHGGAGDADAQGGERVEARDVARGLRDDLLGASGRG